MASPRTLRAKLGHPPESVSVFTHRRVHTSACSRIGTAPIAIVPVDAARGAACLATAARVFWFRAVPAEGVAARRRRRFVHRSPTSGRTLSFWKVCESASPSRCARVESTSYSFETSYVVGRQTQRGAVNGLHLNTARQSISHFTRPTTSTKYLRRTDSDGHWAQEGRYYLRGTKRVAASTL